MSSEDHRLGPRRGGVRRWAVRGALLATSMAVALLVLEAVLVRTNAGGILYFGETHRYLQEAIELLPEADRPDGRIFENRPGVAVAFHDFSYSTGAHGLRAAVPGAPVPDRAQAAGPRVLFLGDSVTLGWGVDDADTWVRVLERRLADAGLQPVCMNAGHLQYNTIQEADWLAEHGPALAPDLVVLTFVVNDLDDAWGTYQDLKAQLVEAAEAEPTRLERLSLAFGERFPGLRSFARLREVRGEARTHGENEAIDPVTHPTYVAGEPLARAALDRILATTEALGAELVLLDHSFPVLPVAEEWCREHGVPCFDLRFTAEEWRQDVRNSLADSHANALGNRLLADKAEAALRSLGWFAPRR